MTGKSLYHALRPRRIQFAAALVFLAASLLQLHAQSVSILPLGDSLTWGWDGNTDPATINTGGYRSPLYEALTTNGVDVSYVGVDNGNPGPILTAANETGDDGFNGYTIDQLQDNLAGNTGTVTAPPSAWSTVSNDGGYWLTGGTGTGGAAPAVQVILLQIGANDIQKGWDPDYVGTGPESASTFASDTAARLGTLINQVLKYEPNAMLLVDGTSPIIGPNETTSIDYDMDVQSMIATQYQGTNVRYVDMLDALFSNPAVPGFYYYEGGDGVHLNSFGYAAMATAWEDAIYADYFDEPVPDTEAVPEPSTYALLLGGALALFAWQKFRRARARA